MENNSISFELIESKSWVVKDNGGGIGTITYRDGTYTFQPYQYHQYNADSLLVISRYLNKLNKQGLDILR